MSESAKITCPYSLIGSQCQFSNCLFDHPQGLDPQRDSSDKRKSCDITPNSTEDEDKNNSKRQKVEISDDDSKIHTISKLEILTTKSSNTNTTPKVNPDIPKSTPESLNKETNEKILSGSTKEREKGNIKNVVPLSRVHSSATRSSDEQKASPDLHTKTKSNEKYTRKPSVAPTYKSAEKSTAINKTLVSTPAKKVYTRLVPEPVLPFAPTTQDERRLYLKTLFSLFEKFKFKNPTHTAVKKEYEIASTVKTKQEYQNKLKLFVYNSNKNPSFLKELYSKKKTSEESAKGDASEVPVNTISKNIQIIYEKSKGSVVTEKTLLLHHYIMKVPEGESDKDLNWQICSRCHVKFSISSMMEKLSSPCRFHEGKLLITKKSEFSKNNSDYSVRNWSCCNETQGQSQGCKSLFHHVFKLNEPQDMHKVLPFKMIKDVKFNSTHKLKMISLDCEMAYTSKGFELIKLSIVDFMTEKTLMDRIIKPYGEVIDLNSHVSGIESIPEDAMSYDHAMKFLYKITDENTIIVGHGLENDLNVLRIIYPNIIDTAILFSESFNPMYKDPLKKLAWKYLSKNIQSGQHDSLEDAVIPIQIVKKKLKL
ncbi:nuclease activity protein [[Candida] boidinii]|nr:nuclease activity protein [[Candida] boidinii]OWB74724.1 nuclease activity protein [[Candida] boidinii]